jgi:Uma2 family endonuclease
MEEDTGGMATAVPIRMQESVEGPIQAAMTEQEYLRTVFHPDCEFVEGRIEVRNVGEYEHSRVQKALLRIFLANEKTWGVECVQECRLQVAPSHFRIPDSAVLRRGPKYSGIIHDAPLICVEVLSPEDTWSRMRVRLDEYLAMGVEHVWCFDPEAREARRYTVTGFERVTEPELTVPGTAIRVNVAEVFSALDE